MHEKLYQRVWKQQSFVALEKRIMLSCYIARKLYESNKIVSAHFKQKVPLFKYKSRGKPITVINSHKLPELYETESAEVIQKPFSFVANQVIHSFTFIFVFSSKNKISGVAFNSDHTKNGSLFIIKLADFIEALSPIANCWVGRTTMIQTENGEFKVVNE